MHKLVTHAIATAHRTRDALARTQFRPTWVTASPPPRDPRPLDSFRLFAVIGSWMEEDIIAATVKNALAQGAERVYVLDNASTDDTVARAKAAGACVVEPYSTEFNDENVRTILINALIFRVSEAEPDEHIWWLRLDADEFPHGPRGQTILQYLRGLDRGYRVVGSEFFNHYPDAKPEYREGFHPIDFQPMGEPFWQASLPRCRNRHWKHQLFRVDRHSAFLVTESGGHCLSGYGSTHLREPRDALTVHHFPFREEERTRQKLRATYDDGPGSREELSVAAQSTSGLSRYRSLDAVYSQRWSEVDNGRLIPRDRGVTLTNWLVGHPQSGIVRWYSDEELTAARSGSDAGAGAERSTP